MTSHRCVAAFGIALVVALSATSCHVTQTTGPIIDTSTFLDALSGPIRDTYSESDLIAEGRKVCDAMKAGKSDDQVKAMITSDLNLDLKAYPDAAGQFLGAVHAGFLCG